MQIRHVTIGADPEMFIIDTSKEDKVISSIGIIPGEKGSPWKKDSWPEGFGIEIDNILAEFNIPPVTTKEDFINNMNFMKNEIRAFVKEKNPNYDILCTASRMVEDDQLQSNEAKMFGCSVDFNAYTEDANPKPCGETTNLRSAGCHIHVGYLMPRADVSLALIKAMDVFVGLPSVLLDPDRKRRSLYGKAGCFRLTPYGLEYRVLSSKMYSSEALMSIIWEGTMLAIHAYNNEWDLPKSSAVREAIDDSDVKAAKALLTAYKKSRNSSKLNAYLTEVYSLIK